MGRQHHRYDGAAPGADSNPYLLFDSTALFGPGAELDGWLAAAVTLKNSHEGTLKAYESFDAGDTWIEFARESLAASPDGKTHTVALAIELAEAIKVVWENGGSAQTTFHAVTTLSTRPARDIETARQRTDDVQQMGDFTADGDAEITGTLELGDVEDVETLLVETSRGYRGVRAVIEDEDTALLDDAGKLITCADETSTAATIPPEADVAFAPGEWIDYTALDGTVTLTAGAGVTITPATGKTLVLAAAGIARVTYLGDDVWLATGDLVAA